MGEAGGGGWQGDNSGGSAAGEERTRHPGQTDSEWVEPDPIPVFVPVVGQIPGLLEKTRCGVRADGTQPERASRFTERNPPTHQTLHVRQERIPLCVRETVTVLISSDVIQNRSPVAHCASPKIKQDSSR